MLWLYCNYLHTWNEKTQTLGGQIRARERGYLQLTYTNKEIIFGQDVGDLYKGGQMEARSHQLETLPCLTYNKAVDDSGHDRANKALPSLLWGQFNEPSSTKEESYILSWIIIIIFWMEK